MGEKKVAIVNGLIQQGKYNQFLAKCYKKLGYATQEFRIHPVMLMSCHLHPRLNSQVRQIVESSDIIHCQSGGFFPIIEYYHKNNHTKPFILETPVLRSTTGTLFAAIGAAKSYENVKDVALIQKLLDKFFFTPEWTNTTMRSLEDLNQKKLILLLGSRGDTISDNRGLMHLFHHYFDQGKHARLFYDNEFKVIEDYLAERSNQ